MAFLVIIAIGYVAKGGSSDGGYDYNDEGYYPWDYDVRVMAVQDPWVSEDGQQPAPEGYRLVAIELEVEASPSNSERVPAGSWGLKLTDDRGYAYQAVGGGARPQFPEQVYLQPGEKARGWVTFEVATGGVPESLSSYDGKAMSLRSAP